MIRRLIEADIHTAHDEVPDDRIRFWFAECRTPELLILLAGEYPEIASMMAANRPLLDFAIQGSRDEVQRLLREEEDKEREADREYWKPLRKELEEWRLKRDCKN